MYLLFFKSKQLPKLPSKRHWHAKLISGSFASIGFVHLFHHLLHRIELFHKAIDILDSRSTTLGNPLAATAIEDPWVRSLIASHGTDDRLHLSEGGLIDLLAMQSLAGAGNHAQQLIQGTHLTHGLQLGTKIIEGENGKVFCSRPLPVLIQGNGASSRPVQPEFLQHSDLDLFDLTIQRLLDAHESGKEPLSSGDDFRHSLEVAIGLVRSSCTGHERVSLPLSDRSLKLLPHPYRLNGGDVAGWETIGYTGPPTMDF
mgnify:CR=1 FL=1